MIRRVRRRFLHTRCEFQQKEKSAQGPRSACPESGAGRNLFGFKWLDSLNNWTGFPEWPTIDLAMNAWEYSRKHLCKSFLHVKKLSRVVSGSVMPGSPKKNRPGFGNADARYDWIHLNWEFLRTRQNPSSWYEPKKTDHTIIADSSRRLNQVTEGTRKCDCAKLFPYRGTFKIVEFAISPRSSGTPDMPWDMIFISWIAMENWNRNMSLCCLRFCLACSKTYIFLL
jgi:hypothetical protein